MTTSAFNALGAVRSAFLLAACTAAGTAWAAPGPQIAARLVLAGDSYGSEAAAVTDFDGDGQAEIALSVIYADSLSSAHTLQIFDPGNGYQLRDLFVLGQTPIKAMLPVPNGNAPARAMVSIDENSTVRIVQGSPLRQSAQFAAAETIYSTSAAVGDVGGGIGPELVYCNNNVRIVDLNDGSRRELPNTPCNRLLLVQFDSTPQLEILVVSAMSSVPKIYDATTGQLLSTGPHPISYPLVSANLDSDAATEVVAFNANGTGLIRIDPASGWSDIVLVPNLFNTSVGSLLAADVNRDGRDEYIGLVYSDAIQLFSPSAGSLGPYLTEAGHHCGTALIGNFDGDGQVHGMCASDGAYVSTFAPHQNEWSQSLRSYAATRPSLGDVDADGSIDAVEALYGISTSLSSQLLILDPQNLAVKSAQTLVPGPLGAMVHTMVTALPRVDAAGTRAIVAGGSLGPTASGVSSWFGRLTTASTAPTWTNLVNDGHVVRALATLDINADGIEEVAGISKTENPGITGPCRVRMIDAVSGNTSWSVTASPDTNSGGIALLAAQVDGVGAPDLIAACGDYVRALRGEDGFALWTIQAQASELKLRSTAGVDELLLVAPSGLQRRQLSDGAPLGNYASHADSIADSGFLGNVLARVGPAVLRIDAISDAALSDPTALGSQALWFDGLVDLPSSIEGRYDALSATPFGVVRFHGLSGSALFQDGFE